MLLLIQQQDHEDSMHQSIYPHHSIFQGHQQPLFQQLQIEMQQYHHHQNNLLNIDVQDLSLIHI